MSDSMSLELGAQTRAANLISRSVGDVMEPLDNLGAVLAASAAGFRGQSAAALAQALKDWYAVADRLPGVLGRYAGALAAVDESVAQADGSGQARLTASGAGLGSSGLNMGVGP